MFHLSHIINNENIEVIAVFLILALFRIYLEIIGFDFTSLPITSKLSDQLGQDRLHHFHRWGFYLSIGVLVLFGPTLFIR